MEAKQFIKENIIDKLLKLFAPPFCKYKYSALSKIHFIQIPEYIYESAEFTDFNAGIFKEFYHKKFSTSLCFVTENSIIKFDNPDYSFRDINNFLNYKAN